MTTEDKEQDPALPDWYLQALVGMVNGNDLEFPITLFVSGLTISGQLASGHKYFEGLKENLTQFFGDHANELSGVIKDLSSPGDIYLQLKETGNSSPPQYIHLRCAKIFSPGQLPLPAEGAWWRGRLASVDGFLFGSLAAGK